MRALAVLLPLSILAGCQTLKEVSLGYADAVAGSELPSGDAPLEQVVVPLPGLIAIDPTQNPSLSRYSVTHEEIEAVKVGEIEVSDGTGGCGLPYPSIDLRIDAGELGPQVFARGRVEADGCAKWTVDPTDLGPWFRQDSFTIDAVVDGQPSGASAITLEIRASFVIDVTDKRID
jgi:hypothetical protein